MESYLMFGDKKFSLSEVMERLGVEGVTDYDVHLCQEVRSGVIRAGVTGDQDYPGIFLDFALKNTPGSLPILVSQTEQPAGDDSSPVRTYLYDREDQYFAYSDLDTRPDKEVDEELHEPEIVVSGESYMETIVRLEDEFVRIESIMDDGTEE